MEIAVMMCLLIAINLDLIDGFMIHNVRTQPRQIGSFRVNIHEITKIQVQLSDGPKEEDQEDEKSPEQLQMELDAMVKQPGYFECFEPDNLDESQLPIPLFTGLVVFIGSIAFTVYTYYIGIMGFPDDTLTP